MARFLLRISDRNQRKYPILILAFTWCFGILNGIGSYIYAGDSFVSLMRMAADRDVSIVNLLISSILPLLFSAFAVYLHSPQLLAVLCFLKAWLFGFVSCGVLASFGSAGWLVWLMMMFSDIFCLVPLWWYWIFQCQLMNRVHGARLAACIAVVFLIVCLDHSLISPLLVDLIEI